MLGTGHRRGRVQGVVRPGDGKADPRRVAAAPIQRERRAGPRGLRLREAEVRTGGPAVADHAGTGSGEPASPGIVDADQPEPVDGVEEPVERTVQPLRRAVPVQVVGLDARDGRGLRRQLQEGAVALVGLDDQPLALPPHGPAADLVDVATDDERRAEPGLAQDEAQHRGGGRLAVRPGDGEGSPEPADGRQDVGPGTHRDAGPARRGDLHVVVPHGAGTRHEIGSGAPRHAGAQYRRIGDVFGAMPHGHAQPAGAEALEGR